MLNREVRLRTHVSRRTFCTLMFSEPVRVGNAEADADVGLADAVADPPGGSDRPEESWGGYSAVSRIGPPSPIPVSRFADRAAVAHPGPPFRALPCPGCPLRDGATS